MEPHLSSKKVNWRNPSKDVLIISDFPTHEEELKQLMECEAGKLLEASLPVPISQCTIVSLSQYRPDNNDFTYLEGTDTLLEGFKEIKRYIEQTKNLRLIILLGTHPLRYLMHLYDISKWRGSPLLYNGIKVLPTYHPAQVLIDRTLYPIFSFDINKAFQYKEGKERIYNDHFTVTADPVEQYNLVEEILSAASKGYITIDIETRRDNLGLLCVGFGLSSERAICFVCASESTISLLRELLPKLRNVVYHNALFDVAVFRYVHKIEAGICSFDTMVAQHILEPELPKGLDFLCSTLTWRPCYWADISFSEDTKTWSDKASKRDSLHIYNCLDCVVTYEALETFIKENILKNDIFNYEMNMIEVSLHMSSIGFTVDLERLGQLRTHLKKKWEFDYQTLMALAGKVINIQSHKKIQAFLYEELGLPERKNKKGQITADADALVNLIGYTKGQVLEKKTVEAQFVWKKKLAVVKLILQLRGYEKLMSSYIDIIIPSDNRVRSTWIVTGTETGRWSCALWIDQSGFNAQTLPREIIEVEIEAA